MRGQRDRTGARDRTGQDRGQPPPRETPTAASSRRPGACGATHAAFMSRVPPLSRQGPGLALRGWHRAAAARPPRFKSGQSASAAPVTSPTHGDAGGARREARAPPAGCDGGGSAGSNPAPGTSRFFRFFPNFSRLILIFQENRWNAERVQSQGFYVCLPGSESVTQLIPNVMERSEFPTWGK